MSRIGKQPVVLPKGVKAEIAGQLLKIEGPKGKLERRLRPEVKIEISDGQLIFQPREDTKQAGAFFGMERALVHNMVVGVSLGFNKELHLVGVGYRAEMKGEAVNLGLGYSHTIDVAMPKGLKASVIKDGRETYVRIEGTDKQLVGQMAAKIRALRPPEPYKGKGVRYRGEVVKTKAGKAGKK